MTAKGASDVKDEKVLVTIEPHIEPKTFHEKIENKGLLMGVLATVLILIGGIVEFFPTFLVESSIPRIESVKPYTPLELAGRDLYVKEGCYNCHSQMIRVLEPETRRYGDYSRAGEHVYDFPFQWGSKRTGPDLAREGGRYPNLWHYRHMIDPRSTSPGSIMPSYSWMADNLVDVEKIRQKVKVMMMLGVPYSDEELNTSPQLYLDQAMEIKRGLEAEGVAISEKAELVAMIAYLQRLGKDWAEQKLKTTEGL
jgi:cytochrome c oxidase cbb3-type subunit I/II